MYSKSSIDYMASTKTMKFFSFGSPIVYGIVEKYLERSWSFLRQSILQIDTLDCHCLHATIYVTKFQVSSYKLNFEIGINLLCININICMYITYTLASPLHYHITWIFK